MKLLWKYLKNYKKTLWGALILATINQAFSLLDPQIFRYMLDNYVTKVGGLTQGEFLKGVILLSLAAMGTAFVSRVAKNFQDYYANVIVERVGTNMYAQSVSHSFSLPYSVFVDQRSGEFLQKLQKARTDSQALIKHSINTLFFSLVGIVIVVAYSFFVNWMVGLVYLLTMPALGSVIFWISHKIKNSQKDIIKQTASLAGSTTETLRNVELVKSLGLETQEIGRLNKVNEDILGLELKKVKLIRKFSFVQGTLINALRSGLTLLMFWLIYQGQITLGEFFTLLFYSFLIFNPLQELGAVTTAYQEARASLERLDEILKIQPEEKPESPVKIDQLKQIEFKNISFSYDVGTDHALQNISLKISSGDTIAFVGPSGSGKTTIVKLLVGLYKPTQGEILFNGISNKKLDLENFRSHLGLVSQDTQLFAGTIRENLLFASPKATDQECEEAMKASSALNILRRGGQGLDTKIGEGGLKLSGGEKQRLAIARALLRNPDLIVFDEATSSLDSLTEEEITQTIKNIKLTRPNLITVLVAHRLSTIVHSEIIYVLEKGHIVEEGSHQNLLDKRGLYAALWRQQIASKEITPPKYATA